MTPVLWCNYPVCAVTALLSGLILATYVRTSAAPGGRQTPISVAGGMLSLSLSAARSATRSSWHWWGLWGAEPAGTAPAGPGDPVRRPARLCAAEAASWRGWLAGPDSVSLRGSALEVVAAASPMAMSGGRVQPDRSDRCAADVVEAGASSGRWLRLRLAPTISVRNGQGTTP